MLALVFARAAVAETPCYDVVCIEAEAEPEDGDVLRRQPLGPGVSHVFGERGEHGAAFPAGRHPHAPRGRTRLLTLTVIHGRKPDFSHAHFWEWGIVDATHDDRETLPVKFLTADGVAALEPRTWYRAR